MVMLRKDKNKAIKKDSSFLFIASRPQPPLPIILIKMKIKRRGVFFSTV